MSDNRDWLAQVEGRIARARIRKADLARLLFLDPSAFSAILTGRRTPPPDFQKKVNAALDKLERAEKAGQKARDRVLNEEPKSA